MKSGWIVYKNRRILYADYSGFTLDEDGLKEEVERVNALACQQPPGSVLLLVNVQGSTGTKQAVSDLKESAAKIKSHVKKTAVVGIIGFKEVLLKMIASYSGLSMVAVPDMETAKKWLIGDD